MFSLLEAKTEIAKAQLKLEATFKRGFSRTAVKNIGYPGGTNFDQRVFTDGRYWYWSSDNDYSDAPNPRRLNWFGLFEEDADLQISVEINVAYEGRNDRCAGFFARDNDTGAIYLVHSGRVGGGTKGVSKAAFLAWSNEPLIEVVDRSGGIRDGVLVMPVEGLGASSSAIHYIEAIARFKRAVRDGEIDSPEFQRKQRELEDFYAEARGRRTGRRSSKIDYVTRHGEVVDALHEWRKSQGMPKRSRLVKDTLIDLGVAVGRELVEVFEVKTKTSRPDVYSAIGQLMVHGTTDACRRVIVLPDVEPIKADLMQALQRMDIELLLYTLDQEGAVILDAS